MAASGESKDAFAMEPPPPYSVHGNNPAAGDAPAPVITVAPVGGASGTYVQHAVVEFQFPKEPVALVCKHCHRSITTTVEPSCLWGRLFMCLFCSAFLIVIGCCAMSAKNCQCRGTRHSCPECKQELGWNK